MSALTQQSWVNDHESLFLTNPAQEITLSGSPPVTLVASNGDLVTSASNIITANGPVGAPSTWYQYPTLSGEVIFMGGGPGGSPSSILKNINANLYFNDELLVQAGSLPNIGDWAFYAALSNVDMNQKNLTNASNIDNTYNANLNSNIGFGFGLIDYSQTHLRGDLLQENDYATASNGNQPNATFHSDTFTLGFVGKTMSNNGTWYNSNGSAFEVLDQNTLAPLYSAQPAFNVYSRGTNITTSLINLTSASPMAFSGGMNMNGDITASNVTAHGNIVVDSNSQQGSLISSQILPIPAATYTDNLVRGNFRIGELNDGQLFPYPDVSIACDKFKVGNFIGQPGGENAPAVEMNGRTIAIGSIGSSATTGLNGIAVSMTGSATAGITSPVTTLTGGIVNITGAGGVAVTGAGGVAVTGGTVAIDSPVGVTVTGGGGVGIVGGIGVSIDGGVGVTVLGGGAVSITGGGGISVNDLGGATFRGGNVLLTLGADMTVDNGEINVQGASGTIKTNSIQPGNLGYCVIQDPGNTTTNTVSMNNTSVISAVGSGGQITNMAINLSGNNITNGGSITASNQVYTPQILTTDPDPSLYLVLKGGQGIEVRNSTSALGAVACRSVNLEDALNNVIALTNNNTTVFANGNALAYASALSNWSQYPAVSPVDLSGFGITKVQNMDFSNALTNPALKNTAPSQGIEVASEQGLFVKNINTSLREKIDAKTFVGDNIFLDGTTATPSIKMTSGNNSELYRINGDQQGTIRLTYDPIATNGGFLLDSAINPPVMSLSTNVLLLKAKDPTTDPTGNVLKTLTSVTLPNVGALAYSGISNTNTQTVSGANIPTKVNFNVVDVNQGGFALSSGSVIVPFPGTYEIIPSLIFTRSGGSLTTVYFWIQVNGVDVPNSSTQITMSGNGEETCPAVALITPVLNVGDSVALYFASSDNTVQIVATPASTSPYNRPLTPSAIMTFKLLQTSAIASSADVALQNRLQIVPVGTPNQVVVKYTGVGGVGSPSSWVPDNQPPIAGGTNNGWRFTKAVGAGNTAKINWYPFNPYYPSAPSIGVAPSVVIRKCDLESLYFVISTVNDIAVQGMLYLQIYTYDYVNGSSTFFTNRWDYCSPIYSSSGMTTTPFTMESGFKYLVCAVDGVKNQNTPATLGSITYGNGQYPSQRTTTKLRDPYDIHTDIPHLPFTFVAFNNTPTPQPADPSVVAISAFAINTSSSAVTTALDFTIESVGYKSGGINYEYVLNYS